MAANSVQDPDHTLAGNQYVDFHSQAFTGVLIKNVQYFVFPSAYNTAGYKVHGSFLVRGTQFNQRFPGVPELFFPFFEAIIQTFFCEYATGK